MSYHLSACQVIYVFSTNKRVHTQLLHTEHLHWHVIVWPSASNTNRVSDWLFSHCSVSPCLLCKHVCVCVCQLDWSNSWWLIDPEFCTLKGRAGIFFDLLLQLQLLSVCIWCYWQSEASGWCLNVNPSFICLYYIVFYQWSWKLMLKYQHTAG